MKHIISILILMGFVLISCNNKKEPVTAVMTKDATAAKPVDSSKTSAPFTSEKDTAIGNITPAAHDKQKPTPVYMSLWGNVGGTSFLFDMNGTDGSYIPYNMGEGKEYGARRKLKLVSYNPKDGKCVINAYLKGDYIGQFEGIFEEAEIDMGGGESKTMQSYSGIFKSVKGAKLNFYLYFD